MYHYQAYNVLVCRTDITFKVLYLNKSLGDFLLNMCSILKIVNMTFIAES